MDRPPISVDFLSDLPAIDQMSVADQTNELQAHMGRIEALKGPLIERFSELVGDRVPRLDQLGPHAIRVFPREENVLFAIQDGARFVASTSVFDELFGRSSTNLATTGELCVRVPRDLFTGEGGDDDESIAGAVDVRGASAVQTAVEGPGA